MPELIQNGCARRLVPAWIGIAFAGPHAARECGHACRRKSEVAENRAGSHAVARPALATCFARAMQGPRHQRISEAVRRLVRGDRESGGIPASPWREAAHVTANDRTTLRSGSGTCHGVHKRLGGVESASGPTALDRAGRGLPQRPPARAAAGLNARRATRKRARRSLSAAKAHRSGTGCRRACGLRATRRRDARCRW